MGVEDYGAVPPGDREAERAASAARVEDLLAGGGRGELRDGVEQDLGAGGV